MREQAAPDIGDHALAERHHEVKPQRTCRRQQRREEKQRDEILVDGAGFSGAKPKSIIRRTASGTASVATEASSSAPKAAKIRPR
jgi:hypothetical protein